MNPLLQTIIDDEDSDKVWEDMKLGSQYSIQSPAAQENDLQSLNMDEYSEHVNEYLESVEDKSESGSNQDTNPDEEDAQIVN